MRAYASAGMLIVVTAGLGGCAGNHPMLDATASARARAVEVGERADDTLPGVNNAVTMPLRDFNLLHEAIPAVLVHAYAHPYDTTGLTSCTAIRDQVAALDFALGPDVDIPRAATPEESMMEKGRSLASKAALDAVQRATTGGIPVRSWVRRLSGAEKVEREAKAVALSGSVRRGFLKAFGAQMHCDWPAAPLDERRIAQLEADQSHIQTKLTPAASEAATDQSADAAALSPPAPSRP